MKDEKENFLIPFDENKESENTFSKELFETAVTIMRIQVEEILKTSLFAQIQQS